MIKFLSDENIALKLVKSIRKKGFDVKDIKEEKLFGITTLLAQTNSIYNPVIIVIINN